MCCSNHAREVRRRLLGVFPRGVLPSRRVSYADFIFCDSESAAAKSSLLWPLQQSFQNMPMSNPGLVSPRGGMHSFRSVKTPAQQQHMVHVAAL